MLLRATYPQKLQQLANGSSLDCCSKSVSCSLTLTVFCNFTHLFTHAIIPLGLIVQRIFAVTDLLEVYCR